MVDLEQFAAGGLGYAIGFAPVHRICCENLSVCWNSHDQTKDQRTNKETRFSVWRDPARARVFDRRQTNNDGARRGGAPELRASLF